MVLNESLIFCIFMAFGLLGVSCLHLEQSKSSRHW